MNGTFEWDRLRAAADWADDVGRLAVQLGLDRVEKLAPLWVDREDMTRDLRELADQLEAEAR